jgi:hypothetical protein
MADQSMTHREVYDTLTRLYDRHDLHLTDRERQALAEMIGRLQVCAECARNFDRRRSHA